MWKNEDSQALLDRGTMAGALWMPVTYGIRHLPRLCNKLSEWQGTVQRLWELRRQHWEEGRHPKRSHTSIGLPTPDDSFGIHSEDAKCRLAKVQANVRKLGEAELECRRPSKDRLVDFKAPSQGGRPSSSSEWREEVVPVPPGLLTVTQCHSLMGLVNKETETYLQQFQDCSFPTLNVHQVSPSVESLKPFLRISGSHHYRPPNLGQATFQEWAKKHKYRRRPSKSVEGIAFGRSCKGGNDGLKHFSVEKETPGLKPASKYSLKGMRNARREVLNAIHDYHINAQARAHLEKRAAGYEQEKKEKYIMKVAANREAALRRRSQMPSRQSTVIYRNHFIP